MECGIEMDVSAGKCLFTGVRYIQNGEARLKKITIIKRTKLKQNKQKTESFNQNIKLNRARKHGRNNTGDRNTKQYFKVCVQPASLYVHDDCTPISNTFAMLHHPNSACYALHVHGQEQGIQAEPGSSAQRCESY